MKNRIEFLALLTLGTAALAFLAANLIRGLLGMGWLW